VAEIRGCEFPDDLMYDDELVSRGVGKLRPV
jgi:hypothetical protein